MSEENVEAVQRGFDCINRGDWDALLDLIDPNAEFIEDPRVPGAVVRQGPAELRRYFESLQRYWQTLEVQLERCIEVENEVVVFSSIRARGRASGVELERALYHVFTMRDGKLLRGRWLSSRSEALEAAGLRE